MHAGHEHAARRRADGVAGVALCQAHAVFGDLVDVGRADFGLAERADVAVTEVIGDEEDDVGPIGGRGGQGEHEEQAERETELTS